MVEYKHLWVGEKFTYDGQEYTKGNLGRCFQVLSIGECSPRKVFRRLPKNRMVEPLCERLKERNEFRD